MTVDQLKAAVAEKLLDAGIFVNRHLPMRTICQKVGEHTGIERGYAETMYAYLARYVGIRQIVPAAKAPSFRPMRIAAHPRAAEIDAAQPPMITPNGVGNGAERQHGYARGR